MFSDFHEIAFVGLITTNLSNTEGSSKRSVPLKWPHFFGRIRGTAAVEVAGGELLREISKLWSLVDRRFRLVHVSEITILNNPTLY